MACLWAGPSLAENLRLATFHAELSRDGPGLLLRDILRSDPQVEAAARVIALASPDVLVLLGIDYDHDLAALGAFADRVAAAGAVYPHRFALRPNTGRATGLDMDGDGRLGGPRDAQGYGRFAGEGGMAVLSRLPIDAAGVRDFSGLLWRDLPGAILPDGMSADVLDTQRLSTTGHWEVPVRLAGGGTLRVLAWHATPPVFDGPEDRNGRRNHDEAAFWLRLLEGGLPMPPPAGPFVILGQTSLDPMDGDGRPEALRALLAHPALQDPQPRGDHGRVEPGQAGDAALDTALYDGLGGLRVSVILPSADQVVRDAAVLWPPDSDPMAATLAAASRHSPIWVDLALP